MKTDPILDRILREAGAPGLLEALTERLSPRDLATLLLHVMEARAARVDPAGALEAFARKGPARPSAHDARVLRAMDVRAFEAAAGFEAVALSPMCPLGTSHAFGGVHQNNVLSALRGLELIADPTNVLALLCAERRRDATRRAASIERLCASERVARLVRLEAPGMVPHFQLFALATAGRARGGFAFEALALAEHVRVHLSLFERLTELGFRFAEVTVEVADTEVSERVLDRLGVDRAALREAVRAHRPGSEQVALAALGRALPELVADPARELGDLLAGAPPALLARLEQVREGVLAPIAREFPEARIRFNPVRAQALNFYQGLCLRIAATDPSGVHLSIGDGGFTPWTQALLGDQRERFLTSGLGLEMLPARFRAPLTPPPMPVR